MNVIVFVLVIVFRITISFDILIIVVPPELPFLFTIWSLDKYSPQDFPTLSLPPLASNESRHLSYIRIFGYPNLLPEEPF